MSAELLHKSGLDEVAITLHDPESELRKHSKPEAEVKKFTSSYWFTALVGIGSLTITTFVLNVPTISEAVRVANSGNELNKSVNEVAQHLTDSAIYVNCNDDPLNKLDTSDPLYEDGVNYIRAGLVRGVRIPFGLTFYPPVTTLREDICTSIANYTPLEVEDYTNPYLIQEDYDDTLNYADSLFTLLHEVEHTKEVVNEAEASCNAIQKLPAALEASGVKRGYAGGIALDIAHQRSYDSMSEYLSDECRPGGAYDLDIGGAYIIPYPDVEAGPIALNPVEP